MKSEFYYIGILCSQLILYFLVINPYIELFNLNIILEEMAFLLLFIISHLIVIICSVCLLSEIDKRDKIIKKLKELKK